MRIGPRLCVCVPLVLLCACMVPNKVPQSRMNDEMQYQTFSVERPPTRDWYLYRDQETTTKAICRRPGESDDHTIFASVEIYQWPAELATAEDLEAYVDARNSNSENWERTSFEVFDLGDGHAEYEVEARSIESGKTHLSLHNRVRVERHPAFPDLGVWITASERGPGGELHGELWDEAQYIFDAVVLESAPGVAVGE